MIYLIVGIDRSTFARWHDNVMAKDVGLAEHLARSRAARLGVDLVVAAAVGPYSTVVSDPSRIRLSTSKAA